MSHATVVARLNDLADDLERDHLGLSGFATELTGCADALEGLADGFRQEAWDVWHRLELAVAEGRDFSVEVPTLVSWLRSWTARLS